ncbi:hypothetical protein LDENG_00073500 [Lucifuga dentata]|nr:hypothetical protein LDENG_00073500 [Lucifuga dentata]
MCDLLERTTDHPSPDSGPDEENRDMGGTSELQWEDAGLPVELQRGMEMLRVNGELTDVILHVQGQDFPCHRAVLAAASHYFRAMFCSGMKESYEEQVKLNEVESETMRFLLDYTYTSQGLLTHSNVQKILQAAHQFQFLRVVDACTGFLSKCLDLDNCIGILNLTECHALPALRSQTEDYIKSQFSQVVQLQEFVDLPAEALESLLKRDDLHVTCEECVFEALMRWVKAQEAERCPLLARLLSHVRLPLLEPAYFVEKVESDELIRRCTEAFPLLQEARIYHMSGIEVVSERTKPRVQHLMSEVFLIIGGCTKDVRFISTVACLDPLRRNRLEVARLPLTEMQSESKNKKWIEFACITFRNEVYISGGRETRHEVWKYNGALNKWIQVESMSTGRWRHKMAVHGGKVYSLGGFDGVTKLASVEAYDPFHNHWTQVTPLATGVSSFAAATFDRWIYVIGGGPNEMLATNKVQCFEPGTRSWKLRAPIPIKTKCTNAVTFKNHIYVVGGCMNAIYSYSPLSDSWTCVTHLGERASCAIAACNNKLFISGGRDAQHQVVDTVLCWDVAQGVLTEECVLPLGVSHHGSVTLMKSYTNTQNSSCFRA